MYASKFIAEISIFFLLYTDCGAIKSSQLLKNLLIILRQYVAGGFLLLFVCGILSHIDFFGMSF